MRSFPRAMATSLRTGYGPEPVEREVELEHVDALLAEEAEDAAVGVVVDERRAPRRPARPRSSATRARLEPALATEMCGSSPEPDAVTASTGTGVSAASPLAPRYAVDPLAATALRAARGSSGPRLEPRLERRVVAGVGRSSVAAEGRDWKYSASGSPSSSTKAWPISSEPTALPSTSTSEPFGLVGNDDLARRR